MREYVGFISNMNEVCIDENTPIVRCCDCKHFTPKGTYKFENGKVNADYCEYVRGWMLQITPNGFCAWGERGERTCRMLDRGSFIPHHDFHRIECSECGVIYWQAPGHLPAVRYCPNCGAKVIE